MKNNWTATDIPDLTGKICVVTGASAGLGVEITAQIAKHGATVIMAVRNVEKGEKAKQEIQKTVGKTAKLEVMKLDVSNWDSVRAFAKEFREKWKVVDILSCNAGVMALNPQQRTESGLEMQWATNHLGHFLLISEMWETIQASKNCHITMHSSSAHRMGKFDWDNLNAEKKYDPWGQYGMTKLANLTFAKELARRVEEAGLKSPVVTSCHPGWVETELQEKASFDAGTKMLSVLFSPTKGTASTGSLPMLYGLTSPEAKPGAYYGPSGPIGMGGKNPRERPGSKAARDSNSMKKLWEVSEETLKIKFVI